MPSDKPGVEYAFNYLEGQGYEPEIIHKPVDIKATKNGEDYWFEVKYTEKHRGQPFGAATLTEWRKALEDPDKFKFLIVNKPGGVAYDSEFSCVEVSPEEFMLYSTVPPFKVNFNWPLDESKRKPPNRRSSTIVPTWDTIQRLDQYFDELKK